LRLLSPSAWRTSILLWLPDRGRGRCLASDYCQWRLASLCPITNSWRIPRRKILVDAAVGRGGLKVDQGLWRRRNLHRLVGRILMQDGILFADLPVRIAARDELAQKFPW
jgi:hypothetical protein